MSKDMLIDSAHAEEIRIAVVDDGKLDKFDFETRSKVRVKGNVYLAKVIRVEPSLQAAFVDYGGNRHGFLSFSEIHYDYFQIPVNDRQELEAHLQNAIAAHIAETGQTAEEIDQKEIARLRYQFYRRYKIQEVIKKRQIMLVQVTKEERGNKGAALTTYISLAGRYCVLMPNTPKGSGVSRKITNRNDREKLKKIVSELFIENGSTVIRTAGIGHTKAEIKKDFTYLKNLWNEIREITLKSSAPCLIHEEAGIIKRSLRDMYSKEIESVVVEGESGYKVAKKFMKKLMPSHSKKVKLYDDKNVPLFSKYKLNEQISQIYSTRVDLPSGGYLVINNTEALIAIDVNSGKSTRERNIAGTALKTNLEAAQEIARQCRLRDLAGLIVVDFIDMEEKRNNLQVERCMRDALKNDKAKIQVGTISNFGLLEFSRQRLRSSIADANMIVCPHCRGTGFMWCEESFAVQILRKIEEICVSGDFKEIVVTLSGNIALYILNNKRSFISAIESRGNFKITFNIDHRIANTEFRIDPIARPKPKVISEDDSDSESEKKAEPNKKHIKTKNKESINNRSEVKPGLKRKKTFKPHQNQRFEKTDEDIQSDKLEKSPETETVVHKIAKRPMANSKKDELYAKPIPIDTPEDLEISKIQEEKKAKKAKTKKIKAAKAEEKLEKTEKIEKSEKVKKTKETKGSQKSKARAKASSQTDQIELDIEVPAAPKKRGRKKAIKNKEETPLVTVEAENKEEASLFEVESENKEKKAIEKPKAKKKAKKVEKTQSIKKAEKTETVEKSETNEEKPKKKTTTRKTKKSAESKEETAPETQNGKTVPELKEGKVDFSSKIEVSKYQRDIVTKVMQSYQEQELNNSSLSNKTAPPIAKKKRNGWWQKLLKKPEDKQGEAI